MRAPRVSVVIPFYNAERFLLETIESVRSQTCSDWELLLVDDGSTDASAQIARDCANADPQRIRYCEHEGHLNRGLTATRNLGVQQSHSDVIAFLDADDIWMSEKLTVHLAELEAHPVAGFLFAPTVYWYEWSAEASGAERDWIPPLAPGGRVYAPPALLAASYPLGSWGSPCPCSFIARRAALDAVGGFEECFHRGTFQLYEDIAFLAKIYLQVPVYVSAACLDRNRCNPYSMTRQRDAKRKEEAARRFYFRWLNGYLAEHGVGDAEIVRAVRRESWFYVLPLPVSRVYRRARAKIERLRARLAH